MQKKICLLGGFGVGKTSLVSRFVHSIFSDKYLTTIGVTIEKKTVMVDQSRIDLVIWDLYGHDDFQTLQTSYLRGASGYLLVADGTRPETLDTALELQRLASDTIGDAPFILALNKADLVDNWRITDRQVDDLLGRGWAVLKTSAKTGDLVEGAFTAIGRAMVAPAIGNSQP